MSLGRDLVKYHDIICSAGLDAVGTVGDSVLVSPHDFVVGNGPGIGTCNIVSHQTSYLEGAFFVKGRGASVIGISHGLGIAGFFHILAEFLQGTAACRLDDSDNTPQEQERSHGEKHNVHAAQGNLILTVNIIGKSSFRDFFICKICLPEIILKIRIFLAVQLPDLAAQADGLGSYFVKGIFRHLIQLVLVACGNLGRHITPVGGIFVAAPDDVIIMCGTGCVCLGIALIFFQITAETLCGVEFHQFALRDLVRCQLRKIGVSCHGIKRINGIPACQSQTYENQKDRSKYGTF